MFAPKREGEHMVRNRLTVNLDDELRSILQEGAQREGRTMSAFSKRLLDRAAREQQVRAWQAEQPATAQRSTAA
jgi:hypothetical protein